MLNNETVFGTMRSAQVLFRKIGKSIDLAAFDRNSETVGSKNDYVFVVRKWSHFRAQNLDSKWRVFVGNNFALQNRLGYCFGKSIDLAAFDRNSEIAGTKKDYVFVTRKCSHFRVQNLD